MALEERKVAEDFKRVRWADKKMRNRVRGMSRWWRKKKS